MEKAKLIKAAKEERLDYGIVIKGVNPTAGQLVGSPVLTYKVHVADGREVVEPIAPPAAAAAPGVVPESEAEAARETMRRSG